MLDKIPPIVRSAADYALAIRGKRDLLQALFYATRINAAEAWALHKLRGSGYSLAHVTAGTYRLDQDRTQERDSATAIQADALAEPSPQLDAADGAGRDVIVVRTKSARKVGD